METRLYLQIQGEVSPKLYITYGTETAYVKTAVTSPYNSHNSICSLRN